MAGACCKLQKAGSNTAAYGTWIDCQIPSTLVWTPLTLPTNAPNPCLLQFSTNRCTTYSLVWHHQRQCTEPKARPQPTKQVTCDCGWWRFLLASIGSTSSGMCQWWWYYVAITYCTLQTSEGTESFTKVLGCLAIVSQDSPTLTHWQLRSPHLWSLESQKNLSFQKILGNIKT